MYAAALLGVLTTVHIGLQQQRGFDEGCFGAATPEVVKTSTDCGAVVESEAGTFAGVSNAVWGFLFYTAVAGLSLSLLFLSGRWVFYLKSLRALLIVLAVGYTVYLVHYQFFVIEQLCALCLISAVLILTLFGLLTGDFLRPPTWSYTVDRSRTKTGKIKREVGILGVLTVSAALLVAADVFYTQPPAEPPPLDSWEEEFDAYGIDEEQPPMNSPSNKQP